VSAVVGIDLSTRALDLVKLDESSNRAEWVRVELGVIGRDKTNAWARTLDVRQALDAYLPAGMSAWFDDVYLVAIEAPYGRGQAGTQAVLNRVVGAVAASLPARLRVPERCWVVRPDEWKTGLGLKGKPTNTGVLQLSNMRGRITPPSGMSPDAVADQNARDAYCLAMFARDTNAKAIEATATH
jgi:hypothetical protein